MAAVIILLVTAFPIAVTVFVFRWHKTRNLPLVPRFVAEDMMEPFVPESYWSGVYFIFTVRVVLPFPFNRCDLNACLCTARLFVVDRECLLGRHSGLNYRPWRCLGILSGVPPSVPQPACSLLQ